MPVEDFAHLPAKPPLSESNRLSNEAANIVRALIELMTPYERYFCHDLVDLLKETRYSKNNNCSLSRWVRLAKSKGLIHNGLRINMKQDRSRKNIYWVEFVE